jgi:excisionase family DNA binding protein
MMTQLLTVEQVAEWFKLSTPTIYRLAARGKIPSVKVGGSVRFDQHEVARHLADDERDAA